MPTLVRDELSEKAREVYDSMVEHMDSAGFLDFEKCLKLSLEGLDETGGMKPLKEALTELQRHSLVFPKLDSTGWVVRLPLRA